ncbi:MAG: alpha/beta hydrolase, partial [Pseudomonadota bacterium]
GLGAATRLVLDPGRNHFDVIDALVDPDSPLTAELCGD